MISTEFVSVYPLDLSDKQICYGDYGEGIQEAQRRSYQIGRFLHAVLSGGQPDTFTTQAEINEYKRGPQLYYDRISRYLNGQKFRARQLVGRYRVDYRGLTARIGERILGKL